MSKQIKNLSVDETLKLFPLNENPYIDLSNELCVTVGYIHTLDGVSIIKDFTYFKILKCIKNPLIGRHDIDYFHHKGGGEYVKVSVVSSLSSFKKSLLGHIDKMSFEKSSFLINYKYKKLVRLSSIRTRIQLPLYDGGVSLNTLSITSKPATFNCSTINKRKVEEYLVEAHKTSIQILKQGYPESYLSIYSKIKETIDFLPVDIECESLMTEDVVDFLLSSS